MKFQTNTIFPKISRTSVKKLTTVVNETLDVNHTKENKFNVVDLWMIHKQRRQFSVRRFL